MQAQFYEKLYRARKTKDAIKQYLEKVTIPQLSENNQEQCEGELTSAECAYALNKITET